MKPRFRRAMGLLRATWTWLRSRILPDWLNRAWLATWLHPPEDLHGEEETRSWALSYAAPREDDVGEDGVYSLAREYAKERYEELSAVSEKLDEKLDALARTALTLGAIAATLARVVGLDAWLPRATLLTFGILAWVLTVLIAALTRRPSETWVPMSAQTLLKIADYVPKLPKSQIEAVIAASYHRAATAMTVTVEWKGSQLKRATWLFCVGLILIALAGLLQSPGSPTNSTGPTIDAPQPRR